MKKIRLIGSGLVIVLLLLMALFTQRTPQGYVSKYLGIDCSRGTVNKAIDTHGGFHGDGDTFIEIQFLNEEFENRICESEGWSKLPLTENLHIVIYGVANDEMISEPWVAGEIPEIRNGYYYFEDRHFESKNIYDDSEIFERASRNYTIAVYDADAMILYYCEEDT